MTTAIEKTTSDIFASRSPAPWFIESAIIYFLCFFALAFSQSATAQNAMTNSPPPATTLTQAVQVLNLSPVDAELRHPIQFQGVITCIDAKSQLCFVQDSTAGIYVYLVNGPSGLTAGDLVEVSGNSGSGLFSPIVHFATLRQLGTTNLPPPKRVAIEQLASGSEDSQWVEVEGVVHKGTVDWNHVTLDMVSGSSRLNLWLLHYDQAITNQLIDARIRVRGVVGTEYNKQRQLIGFHLYVQNTNQITVLKKPPLDPFSAPIRSSRSLMVYSREGASEHRVRVQGVVTWQSPGKAMVISDETGGIQVYTRQTNSVQVGTLVDVIGFVARGGYSPVLEDASFKAIGNRSVPPPTRITVSQALSGELDKSLVQMEGIVIAQDEAHDGHGALLLQSEKTVFRADLSGLGHPARFNFPNESLVSVTGILSIDVEKGTPQGFKILLRSKDDVHLVSLPSWWKLDRFIWVLGGVSIICLCGSLWVVLLRRRVREQTKAIRMREAAIEARYHDLFENAHDIIFTCDLSGRITSLNTAGEKRFGFPRDEAVKKNFLDLVAPEHQRQFQQLLDHQLAGAPNSNYEIEIISRDGRRLTVEVTTRRNYLEGELIGYHSIARDITARKEAEAALRQSEQQLRKSLEEKERIGRDLHDGIIQSIYAVGLNVEDCKSLAKDKPEDIEKRLAKVTSDLNGIIREVRNFIHGLESGSIEGVELKSALKSLILTLGESHASRFFLHVDPLAAESLTPKQATHLLHVAREAISNSVRHSNAQKTSLSLRMQDGLIRFEVHDNGVGFDTRSVRTEGHGLRNMAARAREICAEFKVHSAQDEGTRIVLDIPPKKPHQ